nr:MAG TPA: hypothetical protein [Caudoviricetes sp.]
MGGDQGIKKETLYVIEPLSNSHDNLGKIY